LTLDNIIYTYNKPIIQWSETHDFTYEKPVQPWLVYAFYCIQTHGLCMKLWQ